MKFLVILRHRMQKSETTVWSISFLIMNLMAKLDHLISNRGKFFMLFMLGEKIVDGTKQISFPGTPKIKLNF